MKITSLPHSMKTLTLSIILSANIFLFLPVTLYIGNMKEFVIPLWSLLKLISVPALAIVALLVVIGGLFKKSMVQRYITLVAALGLLVWIQGSFLVWDYGLLDGSEIDWSQAGWRGWFDLAVWISVILLSVLFSPILNKPLVNFSVAVFFIQLITMTVTLVQIYDELWKKADQHTSVTALNEIYKFSSNRNVLHMILDSFQADIFKEIISDPQSGEYYRSQLDGFVFYEGNTGAFPYTYFSLPAIVSGEIYHNDMPKKDFIQKVFKGKTILNSAFEAGYEIDVATEPLMLDMLTTGNYTNSYLISTNYHLGVKSYIFDETAKLIDLTLFRTLPHALKKYIYNHQKWLTQSFFAKQDYMRFYYYIHNFFLHVLTQKMSIDRSVPVYKFFHVVSPHAPMVVNPDCSYAGGVLPRNRQTVMAQSRCSLDYVIALLNKMKQLQIYDDALIVLMADHGGHIPPPHFKPGLRMDTDMNDGNSQDISPWLAAMITPLMLIKTPGSSGSLSISLVPSSTFDTPATISSVLGLNDEFNGKTILDLTDKEQRERKFYFYEWRKADYDTDYILPIQEIIVNGNVYDGETWSPGNKYFPPPGAK